MGFLQKKKCVVCGEEFTVFGSKLDDGNHICTFCRDFLQGKNYEVNTKYYTTEEILDFVALKREKLEKANDFIHNKKHFKKIYVNTETKEFKIKHDKEIFYGSEVEKVLYYLERDIDKFYGYILFEMANPAMYTLGVKVKFSEDGFFKKTILNNLKNDLIEMTYDICGDREVVIKDYETYIKELKNKDRRAKLQSVLEFLKKEK